MSQHASWSPDLQNLTLQMINLEDLSLLPPTDKIYLKHVEGHYGYINLIDLFQRRLHLHDNKTNQLVAKFNCAKMLIDAGWVVD